MFRSEERIRRGTSRLTGSRSAILRHDRKQAGSRQGHARDGRPGQARRAAVRNDRAHRLHARCGCAKLEIYWCLLARYAHVQLCEPQPGMSNISVALSKRVLTKDVARCRHSEVLPASGAGIRGGVVGQGCDMEERVRDRGGYWGNEFNWVVCIIAQEPMRGEHEHNISMM